MASAQPVMATLPSSSFFKFPPNASPAFIPPPPPGSMAFAPPFEIPDHIYTALLDPKVPLTIATVYAVTVKALNRYNKSTNKRPWGISKTKTFFWFVVLHNVFLAVYSAWTFWGMLGALRRTIVSPMAATGLAGTVDSFCKLSGAPGLGNSAYFDEETNQWQSFAAGAVPGLEPSRTQPGRMWNEGLAFYGWIFYLSKFYEVLDTFIILAKGKFSSTLQTYHHAGAMLSMWAGMRYMSSPIWMFCFVNSGIHAMMYTYYTITAFNIKVPMLIKRSLTTLQITQFLVGASYAMAHSFVSYTIPVAVKVAAQNTTTGASAPVAAEEPALIDNIKNLILGAASKVAQPIAPSASQAAGTGAVTEHITYAQKVVPCITTSSQTFAIWLNVLYLAPLTYLFVSFFIASYIRRSTAESARASKKSRALSGAASDNKGHNDAATTAAVLRRLSNVALAEKAGWDAARGLEKEVYGESNGDGSAAVFDEEDEVAPTKLAVPAKGTNGKAKSGKKGKR